MRIIVFASCLLLSGCAAGSRAALDAERARTQAASLKRKRPPRLPGDEFPTRAAELKLGISPDQVRVALGEPRHSRRLTNLDGVFDLFEYEGKNLRFKNARLVEIRDVP